MDRPNRDFRAAQGTTGARRPGFWRAFAAGLAAPTMVYDPPSAYAGLVQDTSVAASFAKVGALLSRGAREIA